MPQAPRDAKALFLGSIKQRKTVLEGMPTELTIEITSKCQLKCITCPRENLFSGLVHNREMDWGLYQRLAERYVPHLDYLNLSGGLGEPLLYSRFQDALALARSLNDRTMIDISSNALLPRTVRALEAALPLLSKLQISFDAVGADFERIVGMPDCYPTFEKHVKALIGLCARTDTVLQFNAVVTPESFAGLAEVVVAIGDWGGTRLYFNGMNLAATDLDLSRYDFYVTDEYADGMAALVELGRAHGVLVEWQDMRTVTGFEGCYAPWNNFYISWNGLLAACCAKPFPELLNFGHVEQPDLAERINDPGLVEFRRLSNANLSPDFCKTCGAQHRAAGTAARLVEGAAR